jgi:valyl-tRNA synthetase
MTDTPSKIGSAYRPTEVEAAVRATWDAADVFAPDGAGARSIPSMTPFVIIQPPPNVTGALHMGHALTAAVEDALVRRARMQGHATLWLPGVDHASIAAQFVLDRILAREGESRSSLGRERYLERMWAFMDETRDVIGEQHRRLGVSVDWSRLRFTMDDGSAQAVRTAFKRLWDDGLAYRDERLINWCPGCRTSVSDLEVIGKAQTGTLWSIRYHLERDDGSADPGAGITVATTRPETLLGDTAVAVHPDDERYRALIGRRVLVPFTGRAVPIVADDVVEQGFGTGAVKITPAHDHDDFATGRRHDLPLIDVMTDDGHMNEQAGPYDGLTVAEARERIVGDLEAQGDLVATQAHEMVVGRCERSDDIVEPRLKTQWFIRVGPMAERAMAAVREGRTRFVTPKFEKQFFGWMEGIHDWNVSRQLWWGHRIPAWFCPDGHITVSEHATGPDACATCGAAASALRQDDDIFDTWFSSGLWPFSTLGWPERTADLARFYPGTVMETGYDIIFFWVARMMMLGEWLMGREPFSMVYLHGMVRDPYGAKMSKTRGNVVDPLGIIDEVGADALRFALVNGLTAGTDQRLLPSRLEGARNFANKTWNASRFVLANRPPELPADAILAVPSADLLGPAEHWILERCRVTVAAVDQAYDSLQLGEAARLLHTAIWAEYCDWYLELAKRQLEPDRPADRRVATWQVLAWVLDRYLRLLHPIMPHITEHLWALLPKAPDDPDLLIVARWPDSPLAGAGGGAAVAATGTAELLDLISAIRNARTDAGIDASTWLSATIVPRSAGLLVALQGLEDSVERLARVRVSSAEDRAVLDAMPDALAVVTDQAEARLAVTEGDKARDHARVARELAEAEQHLAAARARLADARFTERAPAPVVEGVRQRERELAERVERLRSHAPGPG